MSYTHNESIANTKARESPTFPLPARTENVQLPIFISESLVLLFNYVENTGIFLREKPTITP
jgi:hypothetical protein